MLAASADAAAVRYELDKDSSRVGFTFWFGEQTGKGFFPITDAEVFLDLQNVHKSSVRVQLDVRNARAGDIVATSGMKSREVLNAQDFPVAEFQSNSVRRLGHGVEVEGDLTLRGVTRPVTLQARILRQPSSPKDNSQLVLEIMGSVKRSDFGAVGYSNLVGDQVDLRFFVWVNRL
ncbi:YceI family protein [Cognatishimia sp. WU-CL00825]|uniref:YceI family protein n=1 Tax=Cognatishimia sp. WU-CL00825 TaxID=3127658 RepID=UPI003101D8A5